MKKVIKYIYRNDVAFLGIALIIVAIYNKDFFSATGWTMVILLEYKCRIYKESSDYYEDLYLKEHKKFISYKYSKEMSKLI